MNHLLARDLGAYFDQTIGIAMELTPVKGKSLPLFLGRYDLMQGTICDKECVFFAPKREFSDWTPSMIQADSRVIESKLSRVPIFVAGKMASNQRHRLIKLRVPFAVPGRQMYLPDLLIDLREHFAAERSEPLTPLSPSAQGVFLTVMERRISRFANATEIACLGKFTTMTASRTMKEFEEAGLAITTRSGRNKALSFVTGEGDRVDWRDLWERAIPYLRSPVRRTIPLSTYRPELLDKAYLSGLSALARYSALNAPKKRVWAISPEYYGDHAVELEGAEAPDDDWGSETLEIWYYDPGLAGMGGESSIRDSESERGGIVDRLSLFLALRESEDERVQQALGQMMENIRW